MGKHGHRYCSAKEDEKQIIIQQRDAIINQLNATHAQTIQQLIQQRDEQLRQQRIERDRAVAEKENQIKMLEQNNAELQTKLDDVNLLQVQLQKQIATILPPIDLPYDPNNGKDPQGNSANESLLLACTKGDEQQTYAKTALEKGADPNIVDSNNDSTLHKACTANAVGIVKLLLAHGCNVEVENNQHQKPIELATDPEIKLLLFAAHQSELLKSKRPTDLPKEYESRKNIDLDNDPELMINLPLKGDTRDISGNENHGTGHDVTFSNSRDTASETGGKAESFNFGSQKFIAGDANQLPNGDRTISLWFKLDRDKDTNAYIGGTLFSHCGCDSSDNSANLAIVVNHALRSGLEKEKNISLYGFGVDKELRCYVDLNDKRFVTGNNNWVHLVMTSGNGKGTTLYLNGQAVAHENFFFTTDSSSSISKFGIGTLLFNNKPTDFDTDPMFHGNINDVRLYGRSLRAKEVISLYKQQQPKLTVDDTQNNQNITPFASALRMFNNPNNRPNVENVQESTQALNVGRP